MEWCIVRDSGRDFMQVGGLVQAVIGRRDRHRGILREGQRRAARLDLALVPATISMFVLDRPGFAHGPERFRRNRSRAGRLARMEILPEEAGVAQVVVRVAGQARCLGQAQAPPGGLKSDLDRGDRRSNLEEQHQEGAAVMEAEALDGQRALVRSRNAMTRVPGRYPDHPNSQSRPRYNREEGAAMEGEDRPGRRFRTPKPGQAGDAKVVPDPVLALGHRPRRRTVQRRRGTRADVPAEGLPPVLSHRISDLPNLIRPYVTVEAGNHASALARADKTAALYSRCACTVCGTLRAWQQSGKR